MTTPKQNVVVHDVHGFIDEIDESIVYRHERHPRGVCPHCDWKRTMNLTNEFIERLDAIEGKYDDLYMWSLGTSLVDTRANRKLLMSRWRTFTKRMYHCEDWVPLFRVVEVGRRGFLHFHVIVGRYVDHRVVLNAWRALTKEKSNVHVSGHKGRQDARRLARYLIKYMSKSSTTYRFMGPMYGLGRRTSRRIGREGSTLRYGGVTCYQYKTRGYPVREGQGNID